MLEPRIETKPAIHLMGLHTKFISGLADDTTAPEVIGGLWGRFNERAADIPGIEPGVFYGWNYLDPEEEGSRPDELDYVAGIAVAPESEAPEGLVTLATAPGLYAVFEHRGVMWTFRDTLLSIYREWLPGSDYEGNGIGDLERYDERWQHDSEDSVFEYWVGIVPKS